MSQNHNKKEYILITSDNFPKGGAGANYLNLFCKGLKCNGQTISVWLLKGFAFGNNINKSAKINITEEGIPFTYLSSVQRPLNGIKKITDDIISIYRLVINVLKLIGKRKFIVILIYNNEIHFNIPIYLIGRLLGFKIVSFVPEYTDGTESKKSLVRRIKWYGFLINFKYLNVFSNRLIVFSYFLKDIYIKHGVPENKIFVQPNLTDFDFWKNENPKIRYTLGYSGVPSIKDGLYDLFLSISLLKKRGTNISLLIIGDSVFGKSLLPELRQTCEKLNIADLITFTGLLSLDEVKNYLSECEILILTRPNIAQTQAGFPTKLGEYFASGKRILVTKFGDIEKHFVKNKEMIIAECGNIEDIALKIKWIMDNPKEADMIARNGYKKALKILEYKKSMLNIIIFLDGI